MAPGSTNKALALELSPIKEGSRRKLRVVDVPAPDPDQLGPNHVVGQTIVTGFCLTDTEMGIHEEHGHPTDGLAPLDDGTELTLLGHESVMKVTWTGPGVTRVAVGDVVCPMVREVGGCGCVACTAKHAHMCFRSHQQGVLMEHGIFRLPGFASEMVAIEEDYVVKLPPGIDPRWGCLAEPASITAKAWAHAATVAGADAGPEFIRYPGWGKSLDGEPPVAVLIGAGGIGMPGVAVLRSLGFEVVVVAYTPYNKDAPHLKARLVQELGAHYLSSQQHSLEAVADYCNRISKKKDGPDLVIEMCGVAEYIFQAKAVFKRFPGTVFVNTSITGGSAPVQLDAAKTTHSDVMVNATEISVVNAHASHFVRGLEGLRWADKYSLNWPERLLTYRFKDLHDVAENLWEVMDRSENIRTYIQFF